MIHHGVFASIPCVDCGTCSMGRRQAVDTAVHRDGRAGCAGRAAHHMHMCVSSLKAFNLGFGLLCRVRGIVLTKHFD